ncbi:hypothetical protein AAZX31_20G040900 [Glycine max]
MPCKSNFAKKGMKSPMLKYPATVMSSTTMSLNSFDSEPFVTNKQRLSITQPIILVMEYVNITATTMASPLLLQSCIARSMYPISSFRTWAQSSTAFPPSMCKLLSFLSNFHRCRNEQTPYPVNMNRSKIEEEPKVKRYTHVSILVSYKTIYIEREREEFTYFKNLLFGSVPGNFILFKSKPIHL